MTGNTLDQAVTEVEAAYAKTGFTLGAIALLLATYQYFIQPMMAVEGTAESGAFARAWPLFAIYLAGLAVALSAGPRAVRRAISEGSSSVPFSAGCIVSALSGSAMSAVIGDRGVGQEIIFFYWAGLGVLWTASIAMIHTSERASKPEAVRDWSIYAYAMALLPLTVVPGIPIWPLLFELDAHEAVITAGTMAFAAHLLAAHYVIFEILERSTPKRARG